MAKSLAQEIAAHKQFAQKETEYYYASLAKRLAKQIFLMHQLFPAAPSPPPGYCGAFARLVSPGGGAFANFVLPGGRAFANPGAIPELLIRTRFPIKI